MDELRCEERSTGGGGEATGFYIPSPTVSGESKVTGSPFSRCCHPGREQACIGYEVSRYKTAGSQSHLRGSRTGRLQLRRGLILLSGSIPLLSTSFTLRDPKSQRGQTIVQHRLSLPRRVVAVYQIPGTTTLRWYRNSNIALDIPKPQLVTQLSALGNAK